MRTVNTDRLNQFWNEGILQKVKELTERITRVSEKIDVLDTKEEIEANTDDEKMAGALAVKEMFGQLDSKLNDYVKLVTSDNIAISLSPRASAEYKATFTIPKGYKRLDLMWFNSSGAVFCSGRYTFTQNSVNLWLINLSDYDISVTGNAILLCIRG